MKVHFLKTWPGFFLALQKGEKTFELRKNDRDFVCGDVLNLKEFRPCDCCFGSGRVWDNGDKTDCGCEAPHGEYTGKVLVYRVTYILKHCAGLQRDYVIMSLAKLGEG